VFSELAFDGTAVMFALVSTGQDSDDDPRGIAHAKRLVTKLPVWSLLSFRVRQHPRPHEADQCELSFPVYRAHAPARACPNAERQATSETERR
jgi:hypothetical protein